MHDYDDLESRIEEIEENLNNLTPALGGIIGGALRNKASLELALLYVPGMILAMILSWSINQSILWAILHGYLSWGYVIYFAFF